MKNKIEQLKNSNLIPSNANNFKSAQIARTLINYSINRGENFYRALALLSNKTILQVKYLEEDDFSNFITILNNIDTKLKLYQYE